MFYQLVRLNGDRGISWVYWLAAVATIVGTILAVGQTLIYNKTSDVNEKDNNTNFINNSSKSIINNIIASRNITIGVDSKTLSSIRKNDLDAIIILSEKWGIARGVIQGFLASMEHKDAPLEQWNELLLWLVNNYKKAQDKVKLLNPQDPWAKIKLEEAKLCVNTGKISEALKLIEKAEKLELKASKSLIAVANKRRKHVLDARHIRYNLMLSTFRFKDAAMLMIDSANFAIKFDTFDYLYCLHMAAWAYYGYGKSSRQINFLYRAVEIF